MLFKMNLADLVSRIEEPQGYVHHCLLELKNQQLECERVYLQKNACE